MGIKDAFTRAKATAGIVAALAGAGGDPAVANSSTNLAKQQADYVKETRLRQTKRDTDRIIEEATRTKDAKLRESQLLTGKDRRKLR